MNSLIQFTSWKNLKSNTGKRSLRSWLLAVGVALFTPCLSLSSAWGAFPFVDVNDNGVYDPGVDSGDITAQILDDGVFYTTESLVIPMGANLSPKKDGQLVLAAGKNMTVDASLGNKHTYSIQLLAQEGTLSLGDGAALNAKHMVTMTAKLDLILGANSSVKVSGTKQGGMARMISNEGDVVIKEGVRLSASQVVRVLGEAGAVNVLPGSQLSTPKGVLNVVAAEDMSINGSDLNGQLVQVHTEAHYLEFRDNDVTSSKNGLVVLSAAGSTIDITGSHFNVNPNSLIISAPIVIK